MNVSRLGRVLVVAGAVVATAAVAATLLLIGSPGAQRDARLDAARVRDLRAIEQAVQQHLHAQGTVPASLASVPGASLSRTDPVTGAAYGYRVTGPRRIELCAVFAAANDDPLRQSEPWLRRDWPHAAGAACFERSLARSPGAGD